MGRGAIGLCKTNAVTRQTVGIGGLAGMIRVHHIGALLVGWLGRAIGRTAVKLLPWELVHLTAFTLSADLSQLTGLQTIGLTLANGLVVLYLVIVVLTRGRRSVHDFAAGTVVQAQRAM